MKFQFEVLVTTSFSTLSILLVAHKIMIGIKILYEYWSNKNMDKTCEIIFAIPSRIFMFVVLFFVLDAILLFSRSHNCSFHYIFSLTFIVKNFYELASKFALALWSHRTVPNIYFPFVILSSTKFIDQMIWFHFFHEIFLHH